MDDWRQVLVRETTPIATVLAIIDQSGLQIALVTDEQGTLIGTVTDGDVRRGLLKQISLDKPVLSIMNASPISASINESHDNIKQLMEQNRLHHLPLVNHLNVIQDLILLDSLLKKEVYDNAVILMAGGLGTRLKPLTDDCPKPLLKVGDKPVLEMLLDSFIEHGFSHFYFAINYKGHLIQDYFGDGAKWQVNINYIREDNQLGTAGALSLLENKPTSPFIVMNADLITKVNFQQLLKYHLKENNTATICVREYKHVVPYGVVHVEENNLRLNSILEKPEYNLFVNAGIYVLNPEVLRYLKQNQHANMPDLLTEVIAHDLPVGTYPVCEYWLDIGRIEDLTKARQEFRGAIE